MDEFEAIARYALKDLELSEELEKELIQRLALVLFWDRRLTLNRVQQELGELKTHIENQLTPTNGYGNYLVGSDLDRIRRQYRN